jgi:multimeric flavodoxin WrbA
MKVLLVNGSPHKEGCVFTVLSEMAAALKEEGIDSSIFWIGKGAVQGCTACFACRSGSEGCVFKDELYNSFVEELKNCDGIVLGSPVYYAGPAGSLCAIMDRICFSHGELLSRKVGACVVNARRGGASAAFDRLNKYFTILQMPVVSSCYWNSTHGMTPEEVRQDLEGLRVVRTLARNMAYMLKSRAAAALPFPCEEERVSTNFIR